MDDESGGTDRHVMGSSMNDDIKFLDEQLEEIKAAMSQYRKRYPMLDVSYEYVMWALDLRKKGTCHPHIKYVSIHAPA